MVGFVDPVMVFDRNCKNMKFEYASMEYTRDFMCSVVYEFRKWIIHMVLRSFCGCGARSLVVRTWALLGAYVSQA